MAVDKVLQDLLTEWLVQLLIGNAHWEKLTLEKFTRKDVDAT